MYLLSDNLKVVFVREKYRGILERFTLKMCLHFSLYFFRYIFREKKFSETTRF